MPTMHYFIDPCLMYFTAKNQIEISFPQLILKTKVIKFLKRIFCLGGFCPGGFCPGGFLSRGFLSGGLCPGGFCLGGFCPRTIQKSLLFYKRIIWLGVKLTLCDNSDDLKIVFSLVFLNLNVAKLKNLRFLLNRCQSLCQKGFVCVLIKLSYQACSSMLHLKMVH